jgi:hypothetical protein
MRNVSYTIEQARTQRAASANALIDDEAEHGATSNRIAARDYRNACALVVKLELEQFRADCPPQDFTDAALLAVLSDEEDLDEKHLKKLNAAAPSRYTTLERIDAEMAVILAHEKWRIVFHRKDRRPGIKRRAKRKALVHGDKIKTSRTIRVGGERVPVLRYAAKVKP